MRSCEPSTGRRHSRQICMLLRGAVALVLLGGCGTARRTALRPRTDDGEELRRAAAAAPADPAPWVQLGLWHRERGQPDAALVSLRQALARDADHVPALTLLALLLHENGRSAEALRYFAARPLGAWPEPVQLDIALLLAEAGYVDPAREALEALQHGPWQAAASANLAWLDLLEGNSTAAASRLHDLPADAAPEVRNNLAVALLRNGDVAASEAMLRALVAADPAFAPAWENLGLLRRHWRLDDAGAAEAERRAPPASVLSDVAVQAFLTGTWEDAAPPAKEGSDGSNP